MTSRPYLTAGLRVKDAEHHIETCLRSLSGLVDEIAILDDGSTDRTVELCRQFPKVTRLLCWPKSFFHEGLDRNVVLAMVKDTRPEWILCMDVDEVFESRAQEVLPHLTSHPDAAGWGFRMYHFWRGHTHYRVDGPWRDYTLKRAHLRLFRNQPGLYFPEQRAHGNHVLGLEGTVLLSDLRIKHYGYSDRAEAVRKHQRYLSLNDGEDYSHLVDEAGLQLRTWVEQPGRPQGSA
jgi:glycosyltransferase involved in cell wall biosynthesis